MSDPRQPDPSQWGPPPQSPPGASWAPPPGQPPVAGGGYPAPQPPHQQPGQVTVPAWLTGDWPLAAQIALLGQLLLLVGTAVLTVVGVLREIAGVGLDRIDWPATATRPLVELLGLNAAGTGEPLLLTGLLYSYLAYRLIARRHPRTLGALSADRPRTFAAGVKVALVAAGFLLVIAILLNSFADDLVLRSPSLSMQTPIDFTSLVFFTVFVGTVPAFLAVLSGAGLTVPRFLGLKPASSSMVRGGMSGARRTLLVGGAGLLVLSTIGSLLDGFGTTSGFGDVLGGFVLTIETLAVMWLDQAILLLLGAAKFLHDGGYIWYAGPSAEAWMWVALPVLAAAFVVGGLSAAKLAGPRTQAEAMRSSLLVGPFVAVVSLLVAIGWAGQPYIDDIIPIAILLPSLWGALSVGGAWVWASQRGLPSGVVVGDAAQQPPPTTTPGVGPSSTAWPGAAGSPAAPPGPPPGTGSGVPPAAASPPPTTPASPPAGPQPAPGAPSYQSPPQQADWGPPGAAGQQPWAPPTPGQPPQADAPRSGVPHDGDDELDLDALPPPGASPDQDR